MSFIYSPVQKPTSTALGGRTSASERDASLFAGADAGAKIAAAIADLPSTGGTVDARAFAGAQAIASTITIDRPLVLLLGAANFVAAASPAIQDNTGYAMIIGMGPTGSSASRLTTSTLGIVFAPVPDPQTTAGGGARGLVLFGPGGSDASSAAIKLIDGNGLRFSDLLITNYHDGFLINDFSHYCEFNVFERITMRTNATGDLRNAFHFTNNHAGDVNANTFRDIFVDGTGSAGTASRFFYFEGPNAEIAENLVATNIIISPSNADQAFLGTDNGALTMTKCHFEVYRQVDVPPDTSMKRFVLNVSGDSVAWDGFIDAPAGDVLAGGTSVVAAAIDLENFRRVKVGTGFQIAGAATSGHVLRGNGTDFVDAALAAADLSNGVVGSGSVVLASAPTIASPVITGAVTLPQPGGSAVFNLDSVSSGQSVLNNATCTPFGNANNFSGLFLIDDPAFSGSIAMILTGGGSIAIVSQAGGATYTTTPGNGGTINVYLNSSVVTVENKTGSTIEVRVMSMRVRAGQ